MFAAPASRVEAIRGCNICCWYRSPLCLPAEAATPQVSVLPLTLTAVITAFQDFGREEAAVLLFPETLDRWLVTFLRQELLN